ncbi:hypothetical protein [Massilia varians]|uniref:hypothetical protein n=1 Tax=Massilia varians TaxID=457921 RepID=UPI002557801C|nr:hypothetical protein [Massilia varians]MDK6076685.1 hypothetical protein [Massilia varians]
MSQSVYPFGLTKEYLDVLAVLGTWVAALGSIGAAVVALYLANRSGAQRLKPNVTVVIKFTPASPLFQPKERIETFLRFDVVNSGGRPVRITQLGWQTGLWKKRHCVQMNPAVVGNSSLPVDLEHGQSAHWLIPLEDSEDPWERYFARTFLRDAGPFKFLTLRAVFQTSLGKTFTVRPASNLIERIKSASA